MCLGIPGEVVELMADHPDLAMVSVEGVKRAINIGLLRDGPTTRSTCARRLDPDPRRLRPVQDRRGRGQGRAGLPRGHRPGLRRRDRRAAASPTSTEGRVRCVSSTSSATRSKARALAAADRRAVRAGPALQVHGGLRRAHAHDLQARPGGLPARRPSRWCTARAARSA